ncbi:MAG: DUF4097 family beta strand repeat-containing protein, partial [Clostridia bacterium]
YNQLKSVPIVEIANIEIETTSADIEFIESSRNEVEYSLTHDENQVLVDGDTLRIKENSGFRISFLTFRKGSYIKVYYKNDGKNIRVNSASGQISLDGITAKELNLQTVSGDIKIKKVSADAVQLKTTSGDIKAQTVASTNAYATSVSGDMSFENAVLDGIHAKTTSGEIELRGKISGDIIAESVSGDVAIETALAKEKFSYSVKSVSGDARIDRESFSGTVKNLTDNSIDIKTTSGDIEIGFNS